MTLGALETRVFLLEKLVAGTLARLVDLPTSVEQPRTLAALEHRAIYEAMGRNGGDQSRAAKELGITPRNLNYKLLHKIYKET